MDRKQFLSSLTALGAASQWRIRSSAVPYVEASTTVFYSHPAGETTLVRFTVDNTDAPAGRLRVYDQRNRTLLGTAGVLGVGGRLFGELWLPLRRDTRIVSQIEAPGLANPHSTEHLLVPQPQWTLHWLTIANPQRLLEYLLALPFWRRRAAIATLHALQVTANPLSSERAPLNTRDHLDLLRLGIPAKRLSDRFGIPISNLALGTETEFALRASTMALTQAGIHNALTSDTKPGPIHTAPTGRDGSQIRATTLASGSTPADLGFTSSRDVMAGAIEQWLLGTSIFQSPTYRSQTAAVVGTEVDDGILHVAEAVRQWNSRYAFPHIVVGDADGYFSKIQRSAVFVTTPSGANSQFPDEPEPAEIEGARQRRAEQHRQRLEQATLTLGELLGTNQTALRAMAHSIDTAADGVLVFNPSPLPRTDLVTLPGGGERLATDVPSLGYAYLPHPQDDAPEPYIQLGPNSAFGQELTVRLDSETGAVSSLYSRDINRDWVRPGSPGVNVFEGSVLEDVTRMRLPDIGMRLIARRMTDRGTLTSEVTVYEALPWIDITNQIDEYEQPVRYDFNFDVPDPWITWETPAGFGESGPPAGPLAHLRWLSVRSQTDWQVLFRGLDAPYLLCDEAGRVTSMAPGGISRYRLQISTPYAPPDERWHFGWSSDPFVAEPVDAASSTGLLPRFGSLVTVDEPGVVILGIKPADDKDGAIVFIQDLLGVSREVTFQGGVLGFRRAQHTDVLERGAANLPMARDSVVSAAVPAYGVAGVRLLDLYIRKG